MTNFHTTGNCPRCTPARDLHTVLKIPHVHVFITKLYRQQAEVIKNHNTNVRNAGKGKAQDKKRKRLNLGRLRSYVPMSAPVTDLPSSRSKVRNNKQDKQTPKKIRPETRSSGT